MQEKEQLFCAKCGKANWSEWFEICTCKDPKFIYKTYDEYMDAKKKQGEQ